MKKLAQPSSTSALKNLKNSVTIDKELYYQGSDSTFARALSAVEANEELRCIHELPCEVNDISL